MTEKLIGKQNNFILFTFITVYFWLSLSRLNICKETLSYLLSSLFNAHFSTAKTWFFCSFLPHVSRQRMVPLSFSALALALSSTALWGVPHRGSLYLHCPRSSSVDPDPDPSKVRSKICRNVLASRKVQCLSIYILYTTNHQERM